MLTPEGLRRRVGDLLHPRGAPRPAPPWPNARPYSHPLGDEGEEHTTPRGRHARFDAWYPGPERQTGFQRALRAEGLRESEARVVREASAPGGTGVIFLDLETCGFSGTPLFLVGTAEARDAGIRVTQHVARHYGEEASVLWASRELLARVSLLVTFNGKAYDLPFLRERAILHGLPLPASAPHLDLLHAARRRWKGVLPDCRLRTLEERLLDRRREGDVPGRQIPERYHAHVRGELPGALFPLVRHNRLDLLALTELFALLPETPSPDSADGGPWG